MRSLVVGSLFLTLTVIAAPRSASATTINFESLLTSGTQMTGPFGTFQQQGGSVLLDGFTFESTFTGLGLSVWSDGEPNQPLGGPPATSLFEYSAGDTTTISRTGGGAFELNGIDLTQWGADMPGGPGTFAVTFVGTRTDLSTVTQTFMVARNAGSPLLQSFVFSGFADLVSVSMQQGAYNGGEAFQFNNVVVDGAIETVPDESATLLLLGGGLAAVIARRKREDRETR